ncbi:polyamine aminopropyltransferase [Archaeoglobus veneficus]|uniref:Polyamine aminopropyltransferase n=1 Tax=Archaeoglobus veneficus (strain DSM 11195 / SNP6) TaxID=693661 RepID=F2KML1_ARCVS|nr:polyamine aminopropyltransferase [Archaeoglobus veneficus]AEA47208.1 Spermidine synthase [Archaeoglobus veneficus SNP6]
MEWFIEASDNYGLMIRVRKKLYEFKGLQHIEIYDTVFGKMLVIDGYVQFIERFEASYHEMLAHVPMLTHPSPKKVLIIGGGDGGTAREVLKHDPDEVVMVEIDRNVVEACRQHVGIDKGALDDPRLTLLIENGIEYVKNCDEKFDVLIVDGTDPSPASEPLFSPDFYRACSRISDIYAMQSQSPVLQEKEFRTVLRNTAVFRERRVYLSYIPMYPGGIWSFLIASDSSLNVELDKIRRRFEERRIETEYYTPEVHVAAFTLPRWLENIVREMGLEV